MWINSPLGKWEQETRVKEALQEAERLRAQEEAGDAGRAARRADPLSVASAGLHSLGARILGAAETIQTWLAAPAAPRD
jgi:predicted 2-oxoglutarate/Fe(II)-dependent dioxygenase YbiX